MSHRHLNPIGLVVTVGAMVADVTAHGLLTAVSAVGVVIGSACQLGQLYLRWRDSEAALAKLRLKLFREWERARGA